MHLETPTQPIKQIIIPTETEECAAYWQWSRNTPIVKDYLYKIVNEGKRTIWSGSNLRKVGLVKGVPDYHLPYPTEHYHGLWIEMKKRDGRKKTVPKEQTVWILKLCSIGHYATFCYGWEHAVEITKKYLDGEL